MENIGRNSPKPDLGKKSDQVNNIIEIRKKMRHPINNTSYCTLRGAEKVYAGLVELSIGHKSIDWVNKYCSPRNKSKRQNAPYGPL